MEKLVVLRWWLVAAVVLGISGCVTDDSRCTSRPRAINAPGVSSPNVAPAGGAAK